MPVKAFINGNFITLPGMRPFQHAEWKQAPFLRLIVPLTAGITCTWLLPARVTVYPTFMWLSLSGIGLLFLLAVNIRRLSPAAVTAIIYLLVFVTGAALTLFHDAGKRADFAGRVLHDSSLVVLRLRERPVEKLASWKAEADIAAVRNGDSFYPASGRALLYFQKEDQPPRLDYGDIIVAANHLKEIANTGNPGAFDYTRYCRLHNIFWQGYLPAGTWSDPVSRRADPLKQFFLDCRSWCLNILSTFIPGEKESGLAEALLAGYRDNLDKELEQAYANVGVVHIIAISGLHLGLIYLILLFILKPIPNTGRSRWMKGILIILGLWCFTLITGAAPSALRAAVMFSFFTTARFFIRRHPNKYNTLAASAFLLLCYDPFLLFDVGFQLSYLAVLGILIFQKPIFHLLASRNRILDYLGEMVSVSLAAELLIFPVAVFYFHSFPVLFLLANLLIIPLSSFILYAEVVLLAAAFIPPLGVFTGKIIGKSIALMNEIIERMEALAFSRWADLSIAPAEMFLLYGLIITLAIGLMHKNKTAFFAALSFLLCFSLMETVNAIRTASQRKIIVYNIPRHRAIDFIEGKAVNFVGDTAVFTEESLLKYTIIPSRILFRTASDEALPHLSRKGHFIQYFDYRIALLDSTSSPLSTADPFPVHYVLLSHNPRPDFRQIKTVFNPQLVVFDASNSWWEIENWKTACKQLNLRCFSIPDDGAWVVDAR